MRICERIVILKCIRKTVADFDEAKLAKDASEPEKKWGF
jgi:hypothetical protein